MFVVILTYKVSIDTIDQFLMAHRNYLGEQYDKGYFLMSGPQEPRSGGVIIANVADRKLLMDVISKDPFKINELADYQVIEFYPVMMSDNLKGVI
jgi:uncharacterized protein YciI